MQAKDTDVGAGKSKINGQSRNVGGRCKPKSGGKSDIKNLWSFEMFFFEGRLTASGT